MDDDTESVSMGSLRPAAMTQQIGNKRRLIALVVVLAVVPIAVSWLLRLVDAPTNGWFAGETTFAVGSDFGVFYTAADLARNGGIDQLYDVDAFQAAFEATIGTPPAINAAYANAPPLALAMAPLSWLPWESAWVVWTLVGLMLAWLAVRALHRGRTWPVVVGILLTYPGYLAVVSGQLSLVWLAIFAAVFWAMKVDRLVMAGLLAGLLVLKPPLLVGLAVWWLIDKRMWRTLGVTFLSAGLIATASILLAPGAWQEYPRALRDFSELHSAQGAQWAQFSPWGFVGLISPDHAGAGVVVGVIASAAALAGFVWLFRRRTSDWVPLFAAAIVLTLWVSPHVVAYDWVLLLAAGLALWGYDRSLQPRLVVAGAVVAAVSLWSIFLGIVTRDAFGWTLQIAVIALAAVAVYVFRVVGGQAVEERVAVGEPLGETHS